MKYNQCFADDTVSGSNLIIFPLDRVYVLRMNSSVPIRRSSSFFSYYASGISSNVSGFQFLHLTYTSLAYTLAYHVSIYTVDCHKLTAPVAQHRLAIPGCDLLSMAVCRGMPTVIDR